MTKMGHRPAGWLIGLALVLALTATAAKGAASPVQVSFADGRLSLQAERTSLRAVLDAMAEAMGFSIELRGEFGEAVSPSIRDLPIHSAISKLLDAGGHSFILQLAAREPGEGWAQPARLLVIAADRSGSQTRSVGRNAETPTAPSAEGSDEPVDPEGEAIVEAFVILEEMLLEEDVLLREAAAEALADLEEIAAAD